MFDTMTMTKAGGGLFGAALIYFLGVWVAMSIYGTGEAGHAGGEHQMGYEIAVAETSEAGEAEEGPDFETVFAAADAAKGEKVFGKCKSCHSLEAGKNGTGPTLYGVVGRAVDGEPGYGYSGALIEAADVWTPENLYHFLENPKGFAPGTKMSFAGLKKDEDRADVIAYLQSVAN